MNRNNKLRSNIRARISIVKITFNLRLIPDNGN